MEGVRLSQLARCPRMCAFGALDTPEDERPYDTEEAFFRGKVLEGVAALRAQAEYGAEFQGEKNILRQRVVSWPLGEGHADIYVRSERLLIEVKSSTSDSDVPLLNAIRQLQLYLYFDPEAEQGQVWWIDPRKGNFKPAKWAVDPLPADEVMAIVEAVRTAQGGGELPERVCSRPSDAGPRMCPFVRTCFADWSEEVPSLNGEATELARAWHEAKKHEKEIEAAAAAWKDRRRQVEAELAKLDIPVGKSLCGDYELRRVHVSGGESLSLKKPRAAGLWHDGLDEMFGQFITTRKSYDRYEVEKVGADADFVPDYDAESVPF